MFCMSYALIKQKLVLLGNILNQTHLERNVIPLAVERGAWLTARADTKKILNFKPIFLNDFLVMLLRAC